MGNNHVIDALIMFSLLCGRLIRVFPVFQQCVTVGVNWAPLHFEHFDLSGIHFLACCVSKPAVGFWHNLRSHKPNPSKMEGCCSFLYDQINLTGAKEGKK